MTIEWLAGNRIRGTSTERTTGTPVVPAVPAVADDFTSYASDSALEAVWVTSNNSALSGDATDNEIDFNITVNDVEMYKDIGYDLGTKFVCRFQMDLDSHSGAYDGIWFGLSETKTIAAGDHVGVHVRCGNNFWFTWDTNDVVLAPYEASVLSTSTGTKYFEIIKNGDDHTLNIFSDASYTTSLATSGIKTLDGIDTLRYFYIETSQGNGNTITGSIPDIKIWNGVTTPSATSPAIPAVPALIPSLQSPSVGGWVELGRTTLGSAGDTIDVSSLPDKRYYMLLRDSIASGAVRTGLRLGSTTIDTGSNYAQRYSSNGGSDATNLSLNRIVGDTDVVGHDLNVTYIANLSGKEKLVIQHEVNQNTAGAGTAPTRTELSGKWVNTSNPIDIIQSYNSETGNFDTGSEIVVLGWDEDDTHTTNFWEELTSVELSTTNGTLDSGTFTAKKYLWIQVYLNATSAVEQRMRFNSDSGSNYSFRFSSNGATDGTAINDSNMLVGNGGISKPSFTNMFIVNNSANEKLAISHNVYQNSTGAGTAPDRFEAVNKWDNTSSQITSIQLFNASGGVYQSGSMIKVWGSN